MKATKKKRINVNILIGRFSETKKDLFSLLKPNIKTCKKQIILVNKKNQTQVCTLNVYTFVYFLIKNKVKIIVFSKKSTLPFPYISEEKVKIFKNALFFWILICFWTLKKSLKLWGSFEAKQKSNYVVLYHLQYFHQYNDFSNSRD